MSLRTVHILFILSALGLMAFVGYWSGLRVFHYESEGSGATFTVLLAVAVGSVAGGIPYLGWFIKKTKSL